ncbi:MAG: MliC family protein [Gemmatimonadales bacterium]
MRRSSLAILLLTACAPKAASDAANPDSGTQAAMAPPPGAAAAVFNCTDTAKTEIFALFATDSSGTGVVSLAIGDERIRLRQVTSASGARYADSTAVFWNKGNEVTLERGGTTLTCTTAPTATEPPAPPAEKPAGSE